MLKILSIILTLLIIQGLAYCDFSKDSVGTRTAQFLKIGIDARASSMGGTSAGLSNNVNSIYLNPAGLNGLQNTQVSFMHARWFKDIYYNTVAIAYKGKNGVHGYMINHLSMKPIQKIDNGGKLLGQTYSPKDLAITKTYAKQINEAFLIGYNLKYIACTIDKETCASLALDAGLQSKLFINNIIFGCVMQNLGTRLRYAGKGDALPFNFKMGLGVRLKTKDGILSIGLDQNMFADEDKKTNMGIEYKFKTGDFSFFSLRGGYKTDKLSLKEGSNNLTAGFGLTVKQYDIDYAYEPFGELGITHRVSLIIKFGKEFVKRIKRKTYLDIRMRGSIY